ncbi:hypothetical protein SLA2020_354690 [Shorea laevis]
MDSLKDAILGRVGEYVDSHINFQKDVDDLRERVEDLKRRRNDKETELRTVDLLKKKVKEEVHGWLENARRIIDEMLDIEEEVQNVPYLSRGNLGRRVRQKIHEVKEIYDRGSFPEGLVIERPPPIGSSLVIENLVGEVDVKNKIRKYLRSDEVGLIGVCGIGGVGKTTIMKHIHNELLNEATFNKVIWVTVSHPLNIIKLQGDIARKMNRSLNDDEDELERASRLMDIMKTVKYALILDDVWDKFTLQKVGILEPTMENGCKIVVTSRSVDICNYLRCQVVKVPPLSKQESLNLFLDKVGRDILQISDLEEIVKLTVDECAGLPLAIVVIAGSMRGVKDICEWRNALRELRQCVVAADLEDEIFNRLKFSYDRLQNSNIQNCFLYCSLYPEDYEISKKDLIEDWICEGLIEELGSRREKHDKGYTIINRLENNCLLEKGYKSRHVQMHDVLRDMALCIKSTGPCRYMVKSQMGVTEIPHENEWTEDLEKVSLIANKISYIPINMSPKCQMLSTLILKANESLRQIPECLFANLLGLKSLDLSFTGIEALPNSICNLENLTTLILRGCRHLECIPSLAKLKLLKKLDLYGAGLLVAPRGIEMLVNLEYLDLSCPKLGELPEGMIINLFRLQYLCKGGISTEETIRVEEVVRLKMLESFEGSFYQLKDFNSFVSKLKHLGRLSHFIFVVGSYNNVHFRKFDYNNCLKKVILQDCEIRGEDDLVLPDDLQDLTIGLCSTVSDVSIFLKNITQLRRYELWKCKGIECVVSSSSLKPLTVMNNLEYLRLSHLPSFCDLVRVTKTTEWHAPTSPHIFSSLKELHVVMCSKMKKLFPCELLPGLQNLGRVNVHSCVEMEEIIAWEDAEGNQTTAAFTLPKLRILIVEELPELKRICPKRGVMICDSLEVIKIWSCPKLKRIPLSLVGNRSPSLKGIYVEPKEWWESLEWENPDEKNALLPLIKF